MALLRPRGRRLCRGEKRGPPITIELRQEPHRGKPLQLAPKGLYSWRISDWRLAYRIEAQGLEILFITAGHCRDVSTRVRSLLR